MSNWEKSLREHKPRKHPKNPSFSTILLDEMFRSIDDGEEKTEKIGRKMNLRDRSIEDEEMASLKRAYLMEKLMEKKIKDKVSSSKRTASSLPDMEIYNNDPIFFSTTSSSSSDSSSGGLSLSDAEFYGSAKSTVSCFSASKPKPKPKKSSSSNVPPRPRKSSNHSYYEQSECYLFDDYHHHQKNRGDESLIKSKSRAMKIYSNLVKVKQPISPGGKFTTFLNSLFTNGNGKKTKKININNGYEVDLKIDGGSTTCSSASSFSRSCLSKSAPSRTTKFDDKRSVRFYPVSVIVDEDSRPCGKKSVYGRPHFAEKKVAEVKNMMKIKEVAKYDEKKDYYDEDFDENYEDFDDGISDSSSDLFEIDHLALLRDERFCEELPVYETTHLDRNRAIASGMIC